MESVGLNLAKKALDEISGTSMQFLDSISHTKGSFVSSSVTILYSLREE